MTPEPHPTPITLRAQTVVYRNDANQVRRLIESIGAACRIAQHAGVLADFELRVGDSAETPDVTNVDKRSIALWSTEAGIEDFDYDFFGANLGSAGGNNRLAAGATTDYLLLMNPDAYGAPTLIVRLLEGFASRVAAVEARQVPAEHPKAYDLETGEAGWVATPGLMIRRDAFQETGGFDPEYFFLHGADVDFSWRLRLAGYSLRTAPSAAVFHDKRLTNDGRVVAPETEQYYHIHGRLMLAARYGLDVIGDTTRSWVEASGNDVQQQALADFARREVDGLVPPLLPGAEDISDGGPLDLTRLRF